MNPRTLRSHFITVGKIRKGNIGQRFKEEMPSAKPGHLSFLSKHGPGRVGETKGLICESKFTLTARQAGTGSHLIHIFPRKRQRIQ